MNINIQIIPNFPDRNKARTLTVAMECLDLDPRRSLVKFFCCEVKWPKSRVFHILQQVFFQICAACSSIRYPITSDQLPYFLLKQSVSTPWCCHPIFHHVTYGLKLICSVCLFYTCSTFMQATKLQHMSHPTKSSLFHMFSLSPT